MATPSSPQPSAPQLMTEPDRQKLRDALRRALLKSPAQALQQDVLNSLWKRVYYQPIDDLKRRVKKLTKSQTASASGSSSSSGSTRAAEKLSHANASLLSLLMEGQGFYTSLLADLASLYGVVLPAHMFRHALPDSLEDGIDPTDCSAAVQVCYRVLVWLGDISRYLALTVDGHQDFTSAATWYQHALTLQPGNGQAHHQMAVLATYNNDDLSALFSYLRATVIMEPFPTARSNLKTFHDKLLSLQPSVDNTSAATTLKDGVGRFLLRFLQLHANFASGHFELIASQTKACFDLFDTVTGQELASLLGSAMVHDSHLSSTQTVQIAFICTVCLFQVHEKISRADIQSPWSTDMLVEFDCAQTIFLRCLSSFLHACIVATQVSNHFAIAQTLDTYMPAIHVLVQYALASGHASILLRFNNQAITTPVSQQLCRLLNALQLINHLEGGPLEHVVPSWWPLPEDRQLRWCLPLIAFHQSLRFDSEPYNQQFAHAASRERVVRLLDCAFQFTQPEHNLVLRCAVNPQTPHAKIFYDADTEPTFPSLIYSEDRSVRVDEYDDDDDDDVGDEIEHQPEPKLAVVTSLSRNIIAAALDDDLPSPLYKQPGTKQGFLVMKK